MDNNFDDVYSKLKLIVMYIYLLRGSSFSYNNFKKWKRLSHSTSLDLNLKFRKVCEKETGKNLEEELWKNALPFEKIPGPSKLSVLTAYMPGGKYYNKTYVEVFTATQKKFGNILLYPGVFGRSNTVYTHNPEDIEKVFRADGHWPTRLGFDIMTHFRTQDGSKYYQNQCSLVTEQGESWWRVRSAVNPILMQSLSMKLYYPLVDEIVKDFIQRIREIRCPATSEVSPNFNDIITHWAMEAIVLLSLNVRLGLLSKFPISEDTQKFVSALNEFFGLIYELDVKPSVWKIIPTQKFKKIMKIQNVIFETCTKYVEKEMNRINLEISKNDSEKTALEKMLEIDKRVATVMAFDMIAAGTDTTASALTGCLFQLAKHPEKQIKLREEMKAILPHKDSPLTKDNMQNLPYLRACIKESLRLNNVTTTNTRTTKQDLVLSGYRVPKGTSVSMVFHLLQRDEAHFPKALEFIPERWLRTPSKDAECPLAKTAHPFIYLPFGFGPRACVGKRYFDLELEIALARIFRSFLVEYNYPDFVIRTTIINYPSGDYRFKFVDLTD